MTDIWKVIRRASLLLATTLAMSACSGSGTSGQSKTVSGTAAAGAPIIGTVTIKDSTTPTALTKFVTIEADGKYTIDVSDMKAPYMVRADGYVGGNEYHLYSAGTAADEGGTINITPLTDLIVANIAGSVAQTYFDNGNFSNLTAIELTAEADALKAKLLPILQELGVSDSIDLLRTSFNTDHTGLDGALDILKVTTDAGTGVATIKNIITQQQMTSNVTTGTYTGVLDVTTGVKEGVTDIQLISEGFKKFSTLFATGLPNETNATLLSLFDRDTFLEGGQDLDAFLSELTTEPELVGVSFTNISVQSIESNDDLSGSAVVAFDVIQNGKPLNDGPNPFHMIKKNGVWYMQGDQRIASVDLESVAEYRISETTTPIHTGLRFGVKDPGGIGITSAVVTGAGLPDGGVTLTNNIAYDEFQIDGQNSGNFYAMSDTAIGTIADTGEIYTFKLYKGEVLEKTYTETNRKRPYLKTDLKVENFPTITSPTLEQLRAFSGGDATISWTLPAGLTNDWLSAHIYDFSGNSATYETSPLPADTTKSFTLNAVTSTGQNFTVEGGSIWLSAYDSFGRQLATSMW